MASSNFTALGFHGPARSGKDSLIQMLTKINPNIRMVAFSDAIYREVSTSFKVDEDLLRNEETKDAKSKLLALSLSDNREFVRVALRHLGGDTDQSRTPREILQIWGTEFRRSQDPNYWVRILRNRLLQSDPNIIYAISGVRNENERELVDEGRGFLVHMNRPSAPTVREHSSEIPLAFLTGDVAVRNLGTLADLMGKAIALENHIKQHFSGLKPQYETAKTQVKSHRKAGPAI